MCSIVVVAALCPEKRSAVGYGNLYEERTRYHAQNISSQRSSTQGFRGDADVGFKLSSLLDLECGKLREDIT